MPGEAIPTPLGGRTVVEKRARRAVMCIACVIGSDRKKEYIFEVFFRPAANFFAVRWSGHFGLRVRNAAIAAT